MNEKYYPFRVKSINGKEVVLITSEDVDVGGLLRLSDTSSILGELRFNDKRTITAEQRKKAYALINDVANHYGSKNIEKIKQMLKENYVNEYGGEVFSFSNCSVSVAKDFISATIEFCFLENVPFKTKGMELADDVSRYLFLCIKYRKCAICGKKGEIAHYDVVGSGMDRKKVDHSKLRIMCLCREHHTEQHTIGLHTFCNKYLIQGIKLSPENIKEFKI